MFLITGVTTPKTIPKRLVHKITQLTPRCKKLYQAFNKSKRKLQFIKRKKYAYTSSKEEAFKKVMEGLTPVAKKLIWMQVKMSGKKIQGRRFDDQEKFICLSIMKQSPKSYKFLQKKIILPSKKTLNNFITGMKIDAGINTHVYNAIKSEVNIN